MGILVKIGVLVLSISFFVFTIFFGRLPALRNTPVGAFNNLLRVYIPNGLRRLDDRLTNGRILGSSSRFFHYLMNDRHPTVLILFILLLAISEYCWVPTVWPTFSLHMKLSATTIISLPYFFLFLSSYVDPGFITRSKLDFHGTLYPHDHTLYPPGRMCRTCNQLKPPRSKHCSLCRHCVSKHDHHCIFINSCVGYSNQNYFVLLLLTTAILTTSGGYLGLIFLRDWVQGLGYPHFSLRGTGLTWSLYGQFWSFILQEQPWVGGVTLLCILTSPLIYALGGYNIYLIFRGVTTNETGKWGDFQLDCEDGYVFRRPLTGDTGPDGEVTPYMKDLRIEPDVQWPKKMKFVYVRTSDEEPPETGVPGVGPWERIWNMEEVDNIYDLGFKVNLGDVFLSRKGLMKRLLMAEEKVL